MHLVCFIIRIYHDARSPERQILEDARTFIKISYLILLRIKIFHTNVSVARTSVLATDTSTTKGAHNLIQIHAAT